MCFLLIPKFENFATCLCFKIYLHYQPAMEAASFTVTTPCSTRFFQPATTSTPALGGAQSLCQMKGHKKVLKILYGVPMGVS